MPLTHLTPDVVLGWLHDVKDPEVPVLSVVELGVVRNVRVQHDRVEVDITPTYSGCPAMRVMEDDIRATLQSHGIANVSVHTVFREPWTTDWMSDAAREKLRAYGIAPPLHEGASALTPLRRAATIACPFCGSRTTTLRSEFGSTACKAIYVCDDCRQPFDYFKAI